MAKQEKGLKETTLELEGMSCASCAQTIEKALNKAEGVDQAQVNFAAEKAYVEHDPSTIDKEKLAEVVHSSGYDIKEEREKAILKIGGMTCASCAATVEKALNKAEGVYEASVTIASEKGVVEYDPSVVTKDDFKEIVSATGYEVEGFEGDETETGEDDDLEKVREAKRKMWGTWAFTIPIILWMIPEMVLGIAWPNHTIFDLGMILLAVPPLFVFGRKTYITAYRSVSHGGANMDVLIAIGTGAAFITGPAVFFTPIANYAGVAAMIMAFHLTGRYVEETAKGRASQAIKKLLELGAKTATIIEDSKEKEVPIDEVQP
ncbi:MAG: copper ion binding protein, partial [Halanaerobiaceae bacterium]